VPDSLQLFPLSGVALQQYRGAFFHGRALVLFLFV